jgi:hypothetical protein
MQIPYTEEVYKDREYMRFSYGQKMVVVCVGGGGMHFCIFQEVKINFLSTDPLHNTVLFPSKTKKKTMPLTKCFCGFNGLHNFGFLKLKAKGFKNVLFFRAASNTTAVFFSAYPSNQTNKSLFSKTSFVLRFKSRSLAQLFFFPLALFFVFCVRPLQKKKKLVEIFVFVHKPVLFGI